MEDDNTPIAPPARTRNTQILSLSPTTPSGGGVTSSGAPDSRAGRVARREALKEEKEDDKVMEGKGSVKGKKSVSEGNKGKGVHGAEDEIAGGEGEGVGGEGEGVGGEEEIAGGEGEGVGGEDDEDEHNDS